MRLFGKWNDQIHTLQHTSTLYPTLPMVMLAEKLAQITPGKLNKSFFTNSGTEANEMAILTAQLYTGSREVVALRHSYHGRSFSGDDVNRSCELESGW